MPIYGKHALLYVHNNIFCLWICLAHYYLYMEKLLVHSDGHLVAIVACV